MTVGDKVLMIIVLIGVVWVYVLIIWGEIENIKDSIKKGEEWKPSMDFIIAMMIIVLGLAIIFREDVRGFIDDFIQRLK